MKKYTNYIFICGAIYVIYIFFSEFGLKVINDISIWPILFWATSPFLGFGLLNQFNNSTVKQQYILLLSAIVLFVYAVTHYYIYLHDYSGDKKGLIFIGIPIYQWLMNLVFATLLFIFKPIKKNAI